MPLIEYTPRKFSDASMDIITTANRIITAYMAKGFDLTLRKPGGLTW